ncbi:Tyrosine-protein kinase JAK1, partial [Frankliniella fusca]
QFVWHSPLGPCCRYLRYSLFKSRGLSLSPTAVHSMKSSHAFLISSCLQPCLVPGISIPDLCALSAFYWDYQLFQFLHYSY